MPRKKKTPVLVPQATNIYRNVIAGAWAAMRARFPGLSLTPITVLADPSTWTKTKKSLVLESRAISQDVPAFTIKVPVTWSDRWVLGDIVLEDTSEFTLTEAQAVARAALSHPFLLAQDLDPEAPDRIAAAILAALSTPKETPDE